MSNLKLYVPSLQFPPHTPSLPFPYTEIYATAAGERTSRCAAGGKWRRGRPQRRQRQIPHRHGHHPCRVYLCSNIRFGSQPIVRCALRFVQRLTFGTPAAGLKKKELRRIPVAVYGRGANIPPAATDCPICIGEFAEGEMVRVLPKCGHGFHARFIDTWLASHSSRPTCRHSLLDRGGGSGGGGSDGMTSPAVTDGVGVPLVADELG